LKIENTELVDKFLKGIWKFEKNKIYADPQLKYIFDLAPTDDQSVKCSTDHLNDCIKFKTLKDNLSRYKRNVELENNESLTAPQHLPKRRGFVQAESFSSPIEV